MAFVQRASEALAFGALPSEVHQLAPGYRARRLLGMVSMARPRAAHPLRPSGQKPRTAVVPQYGLSLLALVTEPVCGPVDPPVVTVSSEKQAVPAMASMVSIKLADGQG